MPSDRTKFLYAAVADMQNTIRALDTKTNYLMVILLIPLAKLGAIYAKCEELLALSQPWTRWVFVPLIVIFVVAWCMAILAVFKTLTAIDDPAEHISGDHPRGSFFASKLFDACFIDTFINRNISSVQQHHQHLADAPKTDDEVASELAYEHMKLTYIKSLKMVRSRYAYAFSKCWLVAGGAVWLSWLVLI